MLALIFNQYFPAQVRGLDKTDRSDAERRQERMRVEEEELLLLVPCFMEAIKRWPR